MSNSKSLYSNCAARDEEVVTETSNISATRKRKKEVPLIKDRKTRQQDPDSKRKTKKKTNTRLFADLESSCFGPPGATDNNKNSSGIGSSHLHFNASQI